MRHFLDRADAIISATPNYLNTSSVLSRYRGRCEVIPYGIPIGIAPVDAGLASEIRETYGPRLLVSVGRLVYYKGFEWLIEAMRSVRGHLLIIGNGPLRAALEERIRTAGVSDRVTILSDVADVTPYYQAADVFVLASVARSEAFGIVQIEAMACGKPIVNTDLDSGVPFVSRNGESGLTVPPRDSDALAEAVNTLLDDETLRASFGRTGRARVEQEFSKEVMVGRTMELYRSLLEPTA
jgi:rhamnosyl/mannosyltransferase